MSKTIAEIQALSDVIANHLKFAQVTGFASKSGGGSAQVTGLSAAVDAPLHAFYIAHTAANSGMIAAGSITFVADRFQIANTDVGSGKIIQLFWWDKVA